MMLPLLLLGVALTGIGCRRWCCSPGGRLLLAEHGQVLGGTHAVQQRLGPRCLLIRAAGHEDHAGFDGSCRGGLPPGLVHQLRRGGRGKEKGRRQLVRS